MTSLDPIQVTAVLERLAVPYWIGGSLASTFYGMIRTTQDSDIVADLSVGQVPAFILAVVINMERLLTPGPGRPPRRALRVYC